MNELKGPIDYFSKWLPGELRYSAEKAPYGKKLLRAAIDPKEDGSITRFLSAEWFQAQRLSKLGSHSAESHQMTAQLQYAKFAAGLYDKASLAVWLRNGDPHNQSSREIAIKRTLKSINDKEPWKRNSFTLLYPPADLLNAPFGETPFSRNIPLIQEMIVELNNSSGDDLETFNELFSNAINLGGLATAVYCEYALKHLQEDEYKLPNSQLAS
jgi:hypothetical protein